MYLSLYTAIRSVADLITGDGPVSCDTLSVSSLKVSLGDRITPLDKPGRN